MMALKKVCINVLCCIDFDSQKEKHTVENTLIMVSFHPEIHEIN